MLVSIILLASILLSPLIQIINTIYIAIAGTHDHYSMVDALNRTITTYVHGQFVKVEENATITDAVYFLEAITLLVKQLLL
jgi:hypothetical protein